MPIYRERHPWRLNGWQRLWAPASAVWAIVVAFALLAVPPAVGQRMTPEDWRWHAFVCAIDWAVPSVAVYLLGLGVIWVRRGFLAANQR